MERPKRASREHWHWGLLIGETLRTPGAFAPLGLQVVDVEVIPDFTGSPDRMSAWLIFDSPPEASAAQARTDEVRTFAAGLLALAGYPDAAWRSFRIFYTSVPEIEAGGGRFRFFR